MTQPSTQSPPSLGRSLLHSGLAVFFAATILGALLLAWSSLARVGFGSTRLYALLTAITAPIGAAVCFAGALYYADEPLTQRQPWYVRWLLAIDKRLLMLAQLACMLLTMAAAAALVFGFPIPGA